MPNNDRIILDQILSQLRTTRASALSENEYFELFSAEQALKQYDLSYEELESGITDGGGDGGIDALYFFANGEAVLEDSDLSALKRGVQLDLVIVQATTSGGFSESRIDKLRVTTGELLALSNDLSKLTKAYNGTVLAGIRLFRETYSALAARFPKVAIRFVVAAKADEVHPNAERKANLLREEVSRLFSNAECDVQFLTTGRLLELARQAPRESFSLSLAETPISSAGQAGFIALVKLRDYFNFITEDGELQRQLFEANVRDYQGSTEVNEEIQSTLEGAATEDFWWLNNGVTIVASQAVHGSKTLTIEDPQIVNGLQTSTELFKHFKNTKATEDPRTMLIRVIVPTDPASRDRIIKATNSQTYIPPASLRATDKIHRDIEEYLKPRGLYYDRRKNFYKNQGVAVDRIVGIPYMAQAVMAIALLRPDDARSRPSSLLKKDDDYKRIFSPTRPLATYFVCAALMKHVEQFLRSSAPIPVPHRGNIRFHVAMVVTALACGKLAPNDNDIATLDVSAVTDKKLETAAKLVLGQFEVLGGTDAVAKAAELVTRVRESIDTYLVGGSAPK